MVGLPAKPGHVDLLIDLRLTLVPVEECVSLCQFSKLVAVLCLYLAVGARLFKMSPVESTDGRLPVYFIVPYRKI